MRKKNDPRNIKHDPQGDNAVPLPERYRHLKKMGYRAVKAGHTLNLLGPGLTSKISDEIRGKINSNKSVCICITGPPGQGKTYFGIRYAQKLDKGFHLNDTPPPPGNQDDGQVTFSREHIAYLTGENSPLERGQVILTDESHWGIGARSWQNKDQQDVVNYLAAIRSKGFVLIIVVLHTRMIDTLLRDFVLNYEFHVTQRGEATIYRRWFPMGATEPYRKRLGRMRLQLPDEALCNHANCLKGRHGCKWLQPENPEDRCETIRAIYERRKDFFLNEKGRKEAVHDPPALEKPEIVEKLRDYRLDLPRVRDRLNQSRLRGFIKDKLAVEVPYRDVSSLAGDIEAAQWWRDHVRDYPKPTH